MTSERDLMREDYEAWASSQNWIIDRDSFGDYRHSTARDGWAAWQAARRAQHSTAEPFGYFRADSFGWTDCAATDDGAVALYEAAPQQAPLTDEQIEAIGLKVLLKESDGLKKDRPAFGFSTVEGIIRAAEEIHGIGAAKETR